MIPYFEVGTLEFGFLRLHPFGMLAALGAVSGVAYGYYLAQRDYRAGKVLLDLAPWFLVPGFLLAHLVSILFYFPHRIGDVHFWTLINLTQGLSSFGGLFGGTLGAYVFLRRHRLPVLPWLDIMVCGFALAFVFGRIGCAIAHDHPGLPTDFFLAVDYPPRDGFPAGPRHDLGFYELLFWVVAFAGFHWLGRRPRPHGFFVAIAIVLFCPIRFGLDFLRTADRVYFGLTFAQWSCIAVLPVGIYLLYRLQKNGKLLLLEP